MSSPELKKTLNRSLNKLEKKRDRSNRRQNLSNQAGQLFIFAYDEFIKYITKQLETAGVSKPKKKAKKLEKNFSKKLRGTTLAGVSKVKIKEMQALRDSILKGELPAPVYGKISSETHKIFLIKTYGQVSSYKCQIGTELEKISKGKVDKSFVTGDLTGLTKDEFRGLQLGHGEYGAAVSATRVLAAEKFLDDTDTSNFNDTDRAAFKDLRQKIQEYKQNLKVIAELQAEQVVDSRGNFKSSFIPILSGQFAKENQDDGTKEQRLLEEMSESFQETLDILNQKGSRSNKEAIEDTIISNFSSKKELKYTGKAKPKKEVRSKSNSGRVNKNFKDTKKVSVAAGAAIPTIRKTKGQRRGKSNVSSVPFAMIDVFNKKLPETLKKNMSTPRLNYRTGRFSESVRVTDVVETKKGYPSFGYTYQKYPYQTFEPGYAQGSQERDPRKLIDASMREIAAQFALGRFFTRRR